MSEKKFPAPEKVEQQTYLGKQLMESKKYKNRIDLLHALLDPEKQYSIEQVDTMIKTWEKGTVK